ncbi:MAG: 50S ribosomal protein L18 [Nanoarchaeota archaeon]
MKKTFKRRRKEEKTDYGKRLKLLKAGAPRLIFRKTNRYIIAQYVESKQAQDKVVFGLDSRKLLNHGWAEEMSGSLKSITAAYLTGLLAGKTILNDKLKTPILDIGMIRSTPKSKVYGFLKGVIDAGVKMEFNKNKEIFPSEDSIKGKNLKNKIYGQFDKIKSNIVKGEK